MESNVRNSLSSWLGPDSMIGSLVNRKSAQRLRSYAENPKDILEHAAIEQGVNEGGYRDRQVIELVQNSADALTEDGTQGRVLVKLTARYLYCANEGQPMTVDGVEAILQSQLSSKRGDQIGHFGIGFKCVLGVSDQIDIMSRSGSFRVDTQWSAMEIARAIPSHRGPTPSLRLAHPLDPDPEFLQDPDLADIAEWASTIIRLSRKFPASDTLERQLENFPAEFVLFTPSVNRIELQTTRDETVRRISARRTRSGDAVTIRDGSNSGEKWRTFKLMHHVSADAMTDAGVSVGRERAEIIWAVPMDRSGSKNALWAFFPTTCSITVNGILNAPWKTDGNRQYLHEGTYNKELLAAAAELIARSIPQTYREGDPGAHLELLPPETIATDQWWNQTLVEGIERAAQEVAMVPSADGSLRVGRELELIPDQVKKDGRDIWTAFLEQSVPTSRTGSTEGSDPHLRRGRNDPWRNWVHSSVSTLVRRARAARIGTPKSDEYKWLVNIAAEGTPEASIVAIRLADLFGEHKGTTRVRHTTPWGTSEPRVPVIVLRADGQLVAPNPAEIHLSSGLEVASTQLVVHDAVVSAPGVRTILERRYLLTELRALDLLRDAIDASHDRFGWEQTWRLALAVPETEDAITVLREKVAKLRVPSIAGTWRPLWMVLIPGKMVWKADHGNAAVLIKQVFERKYRRLLIALGVRDTPAEDGLSDAEITVDDLGYRRECVEIFQRKSSSSRTPKAEYVARLGSKPSAGPLAIINELSGTTRERYLANLYRLAVSESPWTWHHSGVRGEYGTLDLHSPAQWQFIHRLAIPTTLGPRHFADAVGEGLLEWRALLPVAEGGSVLGLPNSIEQVPSPLIEEAFASALARNDPEDHSMIASFYESTCHPGRPVPASLRVILGGKLVQSRRAETLVTGDPDIHALRSATEPCLLVSSAAVSRRIVVEWGLIDAGSDVTWHWAGEGLYEDVRDVFPMLSGAVTGPSLDARIVTCDAIWREFPAAHGVVRDSVGSHLDTHDNVFRYRADMERPTALREFLTSHGIDDNVITKALVRVQAEDRDAQVAQAREAPSDASRLAILLSDDAMRRRLPEHLFAEASVSDATGEHLASMALAVYGSAVLMKYRDDLNVGVTPPRQWAGSPSASKFVQLLGFANAFAGTPGSERPAFQDVEGPVVLGPLHDFQKLIVERILEMLNSEMPGRGMLSLPTGSGKTRVAVEAVIQSLVAGTTKPPILWIADRDELCEQAMVTWREIWRAKGAPSATLRISRLWGGADSGEAPERRELHVVVASVQTLARRIEQGAYRWLTEAGCVVIDEAHGAITPSYTAILDQLDVSRKATARHLIGLSATPFRGRDPGPFSETQRLVNRFHGKRFDHGIFAPDDDPYPELRRLRVLAEADFSIVDGGSVALTPEQLTYVEAFRVLPDDVEAFLGRDTNRTGRILDAITEMDRNWPVVVFAASVHHAEVLACLLAMRGVAARAISSKTDPAARRHAIRQFRDGEVRVLTNYGVLTSGFDAPKARAIVVARPIFSPGLYMQVIGRGLRGPLNGGTDRCLIVNVADNIAEYGGRLAFRELEPLWSPPVFQDH